MPRIPAMWKRTLGVGLCLALVGCTVEETSAPTEPGPASGKADDAEDRPTVYDRLAAVLHPVVQIGCRGRAESHLIQCERGIDRDEDKDGIKDGGQWPLTIFDDDGVHRVVGSTGLNAQQCDCFYQAGLRSCAELDKEILADILEALVEYYSADLFERLLGTAKEDDTVDELEDEFDPFAPFEEEEEEEAPYEGDSFALLLGIVNQATDAALNDLEFDTPKGACECRSTPGILDCEDEGDVCVHRVCVECKKASDCGTDEVCELGSCRAG